jgi:hypothetical protein
MEKACVAIRDLKPLEIKACVDDDGFLHSIKYSKTISCANAVSFHY